MSAIRQAASELGGSSVGALKVELSRPPKPEFGDYSTNVSLLLAPTLKRSPRDVAAEIKEAIGALLRDQVRELEVAGPGFVNLFMSDSWYVDALAAVERAGSSYGAGVAADPEKIDVEFVSANPTGPLHIGHARHAAFGESLARILEFAGHDVTREFYINDFGAQIARFADSISAQMRGEEVPEDGYRGKYVQTLAEELSAEGVDSDDGEEVARRGIEIMLEGLRRTLETFRVRFDSWSSEASLHTEGKVAAELKQLKEREHIYRKDGATWLRTTEFGDDKDRVLERSDGETTYFASDIAYHEQKRLQGFDRLIDILGADHHGYVGRMKAAFEASGGDPDRLELIIMQLVQVLERGERSQMSKRKGEFVTLDELVADIGVDATRFFLLNRSHDTAVDLDVDLARQQSQDNPVYYCQYAHARIASIVRKAGARAVDQAQAAEIDADDGRSELHQSEKQLIKRLLEFPDQILQAATRRAPHRLTTYAIETGSDFSAFYRDCKVVDVEPESLQNFRLKLCVATKGVLATTLDLLGIQAPDEM